MAREFILDKIITQGTSYRTHPRVCYLIEKIGTDATSASYLYVNKVATGNLVADVAPLHKTNSYIVGPLSLEGLPYAIPPDTDFSWEGASGSNARIIGKIIQLSPGEAIPSIVATRFAEQGNKHLRYVTGTYSFGSATSWADGTEVSLYTLTPATIETYKFNNLLMVDYTGFTPSAGDVVIQFYIDNTPLENLLSDNLDGGVDLLSIPHRDDVSSNEDVFTLKNFPIEVLGDHTFKITAKNVSGGAISLSSASITVYAIAEYVRKG